MSTPRERPTGPAPELFEGQSVSRFIKRLFFATRPKFFPASVLPVLAGTAWGIQASGQIEIGVFVLALLATVCVHASSNVLNDVGDDAIGTDRCNDQRIYPYTGGSRFIQTGILDKAAMMNLGIALLGIAAVAGLALTIEKGPMVLGFGAIGVVLGVVYSLGPLRLSTIGLGETAVAIAFGVLPVTGAAWLQGAAIDASLILYSLPISAWVAAILLINEVPDIRADELTGKRTLPVKLGPGKTAWLYLALHITAFFAVVALAVGRILPPLSPLVPFVLLGIAVTAKSAIANGVDDSARMTKAIESTLAIHTLGALWLCAILLYRVWSA